MKPGYEPDGTLKWVTVAAKVGAIASVLALITMIAVQSGPPEWDGANGATAAATAAFA